MKQIFILLLLLPVITYAQIDSEYSNSFSTHSDNVISKAKEWMLKNNCQSLSVTMDNDLKFSSGIKSLPENVEIPVGKKSITTVYTFSYTFKVSQVNDSVFINVNDITVIGSIGNSVRVNVWRESIAKQTLVSKKAMNKFIASIDPVLLKVSEQIKNDISSLTSFILKSN